jgi:hypothetical protein
MKMLPLYKKYTIRTTDTIIHTTVVGVNDSALKVTKFARGTDSVMVVKTYPNVNANDTIYYKTGRYDTVAIAFKNIRAMEKDLFDNRKWLDPIIWVMIGGGIGALSAIATKETIGANEGMGFAAGLVFITVPVIFIGTRKTTLDMERVWTFTK